MSGPQIGFKDRKYDSATSHRCCLKPTGEWNRHGAPTLGAALAYYTVLSLAPLLVIAVAIARIAFRRETVQNQIGSQVSGLMGQAGADAFRAMLVNAQSPKSGAIATVVGIVVLLFGASGVFSELRNLENDNETTFFTAGPGDRALGGRAGADNNPGAVRRAGLERSLA